MYTNFLPCLLSLSFAIILRPNPVLQMSDKSQRGSFYNASDPSSIQAPHFRHVRLLMTLSRVHFVYNITVYVQFYSNLSTTSSVSLQAFSSDNLTEGSHRFNDDLHHSPRTCKVVDWTYPSFVARRCHVVGVDQCASFTLDVAKYTDAVSFAFNNRKLSLMFERVEIHADVFEDGEDIYLPAGKDALKVTGVTGEYPVHSIQRPGEPEWTFCDWMMYDGRLEADAGHPVVTLHRSGGSLNVYLDTAAVVDTVTLYVQEKPGVVTVRLDTPSRDVCEPRHTLLSITHATRVLYNCRYHRSTRTVILNYEGRTSDIGIYEIAISGHRGNPASMTTMTGEGRWSGLRFRLAALAFVMFSFVILVLMVNRYNGSEASAISRLPGYQRDDWWSSLNREPGTAVVSLALTNSCTVGRCDTKVTRYSSARKYTPLYIEAGHSSADYDDPGKLNFGPHSVRGGSTSVRDSLPKKSWMYSRILQAPSLPNSTKHAESAARGRCKKRLLNDSVISEAPSNVFSSEDTSMGRVSQGITKLDVDVGIPVTKIIFKDYSEHD